MHNIRPTHGFWGFSAHPVNQGLYQFQNKFVFADQIAFTQSVGGNAIRVDLSTNSVGIIPNSASSYQWGRLFGTSPADVGYASNSTDVRRNNFGLWHKYNALGITVIPMIAVRSRDNSSQAHWTDKYADTTAAYNAGFAQGSGFATEYSPYFPYMELGNEIELFTGIQTSGSGNSASHYDTAKLVLAVAYIKGMEEGIKSVAPETITMFGSAGWAHFYIIDQVFAAAPTIDKVVLHHYLDHQAAIKNGTFPGYSTFYSIFDVYADRYPGKGVWVTEMGYRWSNSFTYQQNEQRSLDNFIDIVNDYNESSNGEAIFLHEMMEMRTQVANTGDQWYGQIGYPEYAETGISNPYKKLLGQWLEFQEAEVEGFGIKYTVPFKNIANQQCRVDILLKDYEGDVTQLRGTGRGNTFTLIWQPDEETMSHVLIASNATLNVYQQDGNIDVEELQLLGDRDGLMQYYEGDVLKWKGFVVSDGLQQPFNGAVESVTIQATDGLKLLEGVNTTSPNTTATGTPNRAPINYFRDLLWNRLGNELPIRFVINSLECTAYPDTNVMAGSVQWSPRGQGYSDDAGNVRSAYWTLFGMTDSFFARIYQSDGYWVVERKTDIITGAYEAKEVEDITITDVSVNVNKTIGKTGDYPFIREDAFLMTKAAIKKAETTYNHTQKENIVPNGDMNATLLGTILYWGKSGESGVLSSYGGGLNLRGGFGLRVQNDGIFGGGDLYVTPLDQAVEGLPLDSNVLFNTMELGFTFMPINYPLSGEYIDWTNNPLQITVKYTVRDGAGAKDYYLNEFGYWQDSPRGSDLGTSFQYQTSESVGGPNPYNDNRIYFSGSPNIGDVISIGIIRNRYGSVRDYYTATCEAAEEGNLELFLNKALAALPASTGGWDLFNKQVNMASGDPNSGHIRYSIVVGYGQPEVTTYKSGELQDFTRISFTVDQMKLNDVARVQIQSKTNEGKILIPDCGSLEQAVDTGVGRLYIQLHVKDGQDVVFDDVYCNVNDNSDVYSAEILTSNGNTAVEKRELNISSSFNGFFNSNYMTAWTRSSDEYRFDNGTDEGSLTRLHAIDTLRTRSKAAKVFTGSINVRSGGWKFGEVYTIPTLDGKKFISLGATWKCEDCEVQLTALEAFYDTELMLDVKHYGSETEPINI